MAGVSVSERIISTEEPEVPDSSFLEEVFEEVFTNPINLVLVLAILYLIYKIFSSRRAEDASYPPPPPPLPKMKKQDLRLEDLLKYNGDHESGRILVAVNGKVFDVTRGKRFYGPGGPYSSFAGHDASRALALFQTDMVKDEYDDLSDLNSVQMDSVREWAEQLEEKYDFVGKLLKPGEDPSNYSDEDEPESKSEADETGKSKSD